MFIYFGNCFMFTQHKNYSNIILGVKMKNILIKLIEAYQITPSHVHSTCRFVPTCSEYMKQCLEIYGLKGIFKGIKRIFRCHPFGKFGYDPVVKED